MLGEAARASGIERGHGKKLHLAAKLGTQIVDDLCAEEDDDHGNGAIRSTVRSRRRLTASARAPVVAWKEKTE